MPKVSVGGSVALKEAIHVARARAGIPSDLQLALKAGVSYDTLMNWYRGSTVPRPAQVQKIAIACGVSLESLLGPYEGREPEPDTMQEALRRHTEAMAEQTRLLAQLVGFIRSAAIAVMLEDPEDRVQLVARAAIDAERADSRAAGEQGPPTEAAEPEPHHRQRP